VDQSTSIDRHSSGAVLARPIALRWPQSATRGRVRFWELAAVGGLFLLAAGIRWPDYLYVPVFTDEAYDAVRSALIARGDLHTPVNSSPYIGSLQNYLTAMLFAVLGPEVYVPRLLVLIVGCLTVVAAYLLGREWGGPVAGTLTGLLVATNPVHVLVNSHIAWSNSLTPLFTTLGLWQLARAVRRSDGPALAWCGLLMAMALLTHPAAIIILPACAVYLVWKAPALVRSRWLWISAGLFILVYSPVVTYYLFGRFYPEQFADQLRASHPDTRAFGKSLGTDFDSLQYAAQVRSSHLGGRELGPDTYLQNLGGFALMSIRAASGAIEPRSELARYLLDPAVLVWLGLMLASSFALAWRGNPLPLLVVVCSLAMAPLWGVKRFEPITHGRYLMPTIIAVYGALAAVAAQTALAGLRGSKFRAIGAAAVVVVVALALGIQPVFELGRFYDSRPANNRSTIDAVAAIEASREPGEVVMVDRRLSERRLGEGAVELDQALAMLLNIRQIPFERSSVDLHDVQAMLARRGSQIALLDRASIDNLSRSYSLTQVTAIAQRTSRAERQRDPVLSWRDLPFAGWLRDLDPVSSPERRDPRTCPDCADHGVYRIAPRR
jgi:4-amino-4-deoxy-L-arabinose transferase-like glycosyltransferase